MDTERPPIVFYAFDLRRLNGKELRDLAIEERKAKLAELFTESPGTLRYSIGFTKDIEELLEKVRALGLEGLIGKRSGSRYRNRLSTRPQLITSSGRLAYLIE